MDAVPCLRVSRSHAQLFRTCLQSKGALDLSLCLFKDSDETVLLPVLPSSLPKLDLQSLRTVTSDSLEVVWSQSPVQSKRNRGTRSVSKLQDVVTVLLESGGLRWTEDLRADLPRSLQRHGDLVLLRDGFSLPLWSRIGEQLWSVVAEALGAKRLAKMSRISADGFRTPKVTMLLGDDTWVTHTDNTISYEFDVTKCMFSAGNITEKLRVAGFHCRGETVVDLYAGIGYFTLPVLIHADARHVHACEWNPDAVRALRRNLEVNKVSERCTVHYGDNRQLQLSDVADRVILGLIPSSEAGWSVACRLLRRSKGGVLHIHHNVTSPSPQNGLSGREADVEAWRIWSDDSAKRIAAMLESVTGTPWRTNIQHLEHVKSYAPRVHHVVLDLECRPT